MDEENRKFDLTSFFIKGIIVIIFILFVIWLLSITAFSDKTNNNDKLDNKEETKDIFKDNLKKMKDVGVKYFTSDKLPKDRDSNVILSLDDMYKQKLVDKITDKNGKECSKDNSYIMAYVAEDKYKLEVNLECDKKSDKVVVDLSKYESKKMYEYALIESGYWSEYSDWSEWTINYVGSSDSREVDMKSEMVDYSYYLDWIDLIATDNCSETVCYDEMPTKVLVTGRKMVNYYRYRDRYYNSDNTTYKWSYSNDDRELIEQGYVSTGKTKET